MSKLLRIFRRPDYQSEVTQFIEQLKTERPDIEAQQRVFLGDLRMARPQRLVRNVDDRKLVAQTFGILERKAITGARRRHLVLAEAFLPKVEGCRRCWLAVLLHHAG